jgi:hypothetical protein
MRILPAIQTSFTAGELDPRLASRIDVSRYYAGAQLLRNVLVLPQGGVRRRPGTRHIGTLPSASLNGVRLIPFAFNTAQTYVLALNAGEAYVFRSDGLYLAQVTGAPWDNNQAAQMNRVQSADTLILTHPLVQPQRIRRIGSETNWVRDILPLTNIPNFDFGAGPEPVISPGRGWPECATFHQGRLWMGGLFSRPATLLGSKVGDFFNFDQGTGLDDQAINITIDSDQVNAIHQLASGRALIVMTSGAEHIVDVAPPITPKNVAVTEQTRRGIARFVPMVEVDGATLFSQRGGAALRQFLYLDVEQAWRSDLLSLLAPHLVSGVTDMAARKGAAADDADHVLLVRSDGTVTVLTTLRAQEVTGFSRWQTAGTVRSVAALPSGQVFFAVVRNGVMRLEMWDDACLTDAAVVATGSGITSMAGCTHLIGMTCRLILDGSDMGNVVPTGDVLALPRAANRAELGLAFQARIETMPVEPRDPAGALIGRKSRIMRAAVRVTDTGLFTVRGRPQVLRQPGTETPPVGAPPPRLNGDVLIHGMTGWGYRQTLDITQDVPAPLNLLAVSLTVAV